MNALYSLLLGVVQGLTEFLPVSSSGHLVIAQNLLRLRLPGISFEVFAHAGTLLAVLVFFREDVWLLARDFLRGLRRLVGRRVEVRRGLTPHERLAWLVIAGTIPAAVAGIFWREMVERAFESLGAVGWGLLLTGVILWLSDRAPGPGRKVAALGVTDALLVGAAQAAAIFPGISRSGLTISASLFRGMDRDTAARFSFLLSIPAVAGATVLDMAEMARGGAWHPDVRFLLVGAGAAAVAGYVSIAVLLSFVRRRRLRLFGYYCLALGIAVLLVGRRL